METHSQPFLKSFLNDKEHSFFRSIGYSCSQSVDPKQAILAALCLPLVMVNAQAVNQQHFFDKELK